MKSKCEYCNETHKPTVACNPSARDQFEGSAKMLSGPSYRDLLRDPRWQRKRLEVMQKADFTCQECHDKGTTLNVHHTYYEWRRKPWEYPDSDLRCLCEPCHKKREEANAVAKRLFGSLKMKDFRCLIGFAKRLRGFAESDRLFGPPVSHARKANDLKQQLNALNPADHESAIRLLAKLKEMR